MERFVNEVAEEQQQLAEQELEAGRSSVTCAGCGAENEASANYCGECGHPMQASPQCPRCGAAVAGGADICEACGEWLLEGQCKFCYSPLPEGAQFCAECGNPVDGVRCPQCGILSYFDFCKRCERPLTPQALEAISELRSSEELRAYPGPVPGSPDDAGAARGKEDLEILEELRRYERALKRSQTSASQDRKKWSFSKEEEYAQAARDAQKQPDKDSEAPLSALEALQHRKFKSNQEARRFFGALKVLLPTITKTRKPVGWLCKAFNCLHPDGPQGCALPSAGGEWMFEEITSSEIREVEI